MVDVYIYLDYSNDKHAFLQPRCLAKGYNVILVKEIDNLDPDKCCIIGTNVGFQYNIFKHINNFDCYNLFDDKSGFYNYLKQNTKIWKNLYLIPSYDNTYNGPNINKSFMVKKNNGYSSAFNEKITGNIKDIILKYSDSYQIQDIMDVKHIYGVSVSCLRGKIIGVYSYKTFEAITKSTQQNGFHAIRNNYIEYNSVKKFLKKLVKKVSYNGFMEVEFIIDDNDNIYIMECNSRISGSLRVPPYFDWLIEPYICNYFKKRKDICKIDLDNICKIELDEKTLWK
jgi:hypothetical protein